MHIISGMCNLGEGVTDIKIGNWPIIKYIQDGEEKEVWIPIYLVEEEDAEELRKSQHESLDSFFDCVEKQGKYTDETTKELKTPSAKKIKCQQQMLFTEIKDSQLSVSQEN